MAWRYICQGCVRVLEGERHSVCVDCNLEIQRLLNLYNRIISERPQHRDKSPAELFELMYENLVRRKAKP